MEAEIEIVEGCVDKPDPRDYPFEEYFGAEDVPKYASVVHDATEIQNQGLPNDPSTKYGCTCYAVAHAVNEGNAIEYRKASLQGTFADVSGLELVKKAIPLGLDVNSGWDLQSARKLAVNEGFIEGFTRCFTAEQVKAALHRGQIIHTGSNKIDWKKTNANGFLAVPGKGYGHAFVIVGYHDALSMGDVFVCRNSYGRNFQDNGHFFVKQSDFDVLYTCAAFTDKPNADVIRRAQSERRRQEAKDRGLWNGERENDYVTRYEGALIASRAFQCDAATLWNGERKAFSLTRFEAKTMLERAAKRKFAFEIANPDSPITRGEMAELSVRL